MVNSSISTPLQVLIRRHSGNYVYSLAKLFSLSLSSGKFPVLWKSASIVPIPKSTSKSNPSDYRPISLLSIVSKLLERYVYSLLWEHIIEHAPLSGSQWGFQKGKSTVLSLLLATHEWHSLVDRQKDVMCVFFDFQKAFDTVPHHRLMERLANIGIHPLLLSWLCSYLSRRKQHVIVNGECSHSTYVLSGVPQGSVLGPLLFLMYIDTITSLPLSEATKVSIYADDLLVYKPIETYSCFQELQEDINLIQRWSVENLMSFKTVDTRSHCKVWLRACNNLPQPPPYISFLGVAEDCCPGLILSPLFGKVSF